MRKPALHRATSAGRRSRRLLAIALSAVILSGCVRVEFDKMSGTQFPPALAVGSDELTITSIYAAVGFPVVVDEDEAGITPLAGNCITESELDSLEDGHRSVAVGPTTPDDCPGCIEYHTYAVTVDHFYIDEMAPCASNGISGLVWTDQRRSFGVFYPTQVMSNDSFYLLVAAHELGHTFGLHHADGNQSFDDATIMNDGGYFSGNNWVFEFTDQSQEHLANHPIVCKAPGARSFWEITPEHRLWSEGELFDHGFFNLLEGEVCP